MPPSPRSLLWPTMEMPRKLYFSVNGDQVTTGWGEPPTSQRAPPHPQAPPFVPMLSVTVMMLRDMVESVTLLKDEVCSGGKGEGAGLPSTTHRDRPGDPLSQRLCPDFPREAPHPLQAGGPLLPPPPVPLEEAGGAALLRGAAEPAGGGGGAGEEPARWRSRDRRDGHGTEGTGRPAGGPGEGWEPYLLKVSSSSESPRLVLSSSLVRRVEELSYPARWRSSREGPLGLWPPAAEDREAQAAGLACSAPALGAPGLSQPSPAARPGSLRAWPLTAVLTAVSPARPLPPQRYN